MPVNSTYLSPKNLLSGPKPEIRVILCGQNNFSLFKLLKGGERFLNKICTNLGGVSCRHLEVTMRIITGPVARRRARPAAALGCRLSVYCCLLLHGIVLRCVLRYCMQQH